MEEYMCNYSEPLDKDGWSEHYNISSLHQVIDSIKDGTVQIWAKELCHIISENESCLEIGCGTGISSLWLAKHNRKACALDYTESSIELVNTAAKELGLTINTVVADATKELPFPDNAFDVIFQSGLLEHFSTERQIQLLRGWKRYCRRMVSIIPNAASLPYRVGKQIMEDNKTWEYGLEIPKHSMAKEFLLAGIEVEEEYSIGSEWALRFLPPRHSLRKMFAKLQRQGIDLDCIMQGYLMVTIGRCTN